MKSALTRFAALFSLTALLSACFTPDTPQEAADAFWDSVIRGDAEAVARYSTLENPEAYDGFGQDWSGLEPSLERIVIENDKARIATAFKAPDNSNDSTQQAVTYLLLEEDQWTVDYERTARGLKGGLFSTLFGEFGKLSQQISEQFSASSQDIQQQLEALGQQAETLSNAFSEQASESIQRYSEALSQSIDELAASTRQALKDQKEQLSEEDKEALDNIAGELEEESEQLSDPTMKDIARSQKNAGEAQLKLISINEEALEQYQEQWLAWQEQFQEDARHFLEELMGVLNEQGQVEE